MPYCSEHIKWLVNTGEILNTADGKKVEVWEFRHDEADETVILEWVKHFRNQYCSEEQIDVLRDGTGLSRSDYLNKYKFPDKDLRPGPSVRAGDFAEILAADYLEYILKYWVPRTKYSNKSVRNESEKGVDTIGFLFVKNDGYSPDDKLTMIESKAKYTAKHENRLQIAIEHSGKDVVRKGESLNAIKQQFLNINDEKSVARVKRFQNEIDRPYIQQFGAIAHLDSRNFTTDVISQANSSSHPHSDQLFLLVIKGNQMMELVHELYKRAADEA